MLVGAENFGSGDQGENRMKSFLLLVLCAFSNAQANVQVPSEITGWFYTIRLPENRVSVVAQGMKEDTFDCSLYGNFSQSDFLAHFKPETNSSWAMLVTRKMEAIDFQSEKLVVRPCIQWEHADSAPDLCLKYDEYEYRYTKTTSSLSLSPTATLTYECDNYSRGRERL